MNNKITDFFSKKQKIWALVCLALMSLIFLYSRIEVEKEDPMQHKLTDIVDLKIKEEEKNTKNTFEKYAWLSNAKECQDHSPRISQTHCLHMVIEVQKLENSDITLGESRKILEMALLDESNKSLSDVYFVLTPILRNSGFSGDITNYSVNHFFETGNSILFKIGK